MSQEKYSVHDTSAARRAVTNGLLVLAATALVSLQGCGGDDSDDKVVFSPSLDYQSGLFLEFSQFENRCEKPRSGTDPATGGAYPDVLGSALAERHYLRSWSHETYLWYDEIQDRDPAGYSTNDYFNLLKTDALTEAGTPKDRFHYSMPTTEYNELTQSGTSVSYGAVWSLTRVSPPREAVVTSVEPDSPAHAAGLSRGMRVVSVDGVDVAYGSDVDTLNGGLFPSDEGEIHTLRLARLDGTQFTVDLTAAKVSYAAVGQVKVLDGGIGYLLFNDHIATAEDELISAIEELKAANVQDLILDLRYNGGGYLAVASQLAYMIAGSTATGDKAFETLSHNDKLTHWDDSMPFISETIGLSREEGEPLPTLDLPRVYVLTGGDTCSASESIINGLRGVDVEVFQIGSNTCGKPFGFYPEDNCGTTYFTIQFQGKNAKGEGDYPDGFAPANAVGSPGKDLPGCQVADDFSRQLGDTAEARLAAALNYRSTGTCPAPSSSSGQTKMSASLAAPAPLSAVDGQVVKPPALQGRIVTR